MTGLVLRALDELSHSILSQWGSFFYHPRFPRRKLMPGKLELATHPRRFYAQDFSTPSWWALSVQNEVWCRDAAQDIGAMKIMTTWKSHLTQGLGLNKVKKRDMNSPASNRSQVFLLFFSLLSEGWNTCFICRVILSEKKNKPVLNTESSRWWRYSALGDKMRGQRIPILWFLHLVHKTSGQEWPKWCRSFSLSIPLPSFCCVYLHLIFGWVCAKIPRCALS